MILKYYGGNINDYRLRSEINIDKNGTTAYEVIRVLKSLGFNAYGVKTSIDNITILPAIAHVIIDNSYKHFVVIYKIDLKKSTIIIADPATKVSEIKISEFLKIWSNVLIVMYPIRNLVSEKNISVNNFFVNLIKMFKKEFLLIGFTSLLISILMIILSFSFQMFLTFNNITNLFVFLIILILIKEIIEYGRNTSVNKIGIKIDTYLSDSIFKKLINLPYKYYQKVTAGEVSSKFADLKQIKNFITLLLIGLFVDVPLLLISSFCLFFINKSLFLITIIFALTMVFIIFIYHKHLKNCLDNLKELKAIESSFTMETLKGIETVKGLALEKKVCNVYLKKHNEFLNEYYNLNKIYNKCNYFKNMLNMISNITIIYFGILFVRSNLIDLSLLITYMFILNYFMESTINLTSLNYEKEDSIISLKKINNLISYDEKMGNDNLTEFDISFKNVSCKYGESKALNNISFDVPFKEKVMIVGNSGSGKSTILKLLMKYYDYSGKLMIGKKDVNNINTVNLRNNIIYISQNENLFTTTLEKNLKIAGEDNFEKNLDMCILDEIINNNNLGLYQLIEEGGINISGGQKQRIVLARSLMRKFKILLIDEGLNGLDVSMERKILKNIFKRFSDKTIILISHRLDNADLFDRVIRIEKGQITFNENKNKGEI
jgi:ATP-binding cassette subfamily B protein